MKPLRFLHVPKTAGSTLNLILHRQYLGKKMFSLTHFEDPTKESFQSRPDRFKNNIMLFFGHAPLVTGIEKADNFTTITLLREPISRVKSFCQHVSEGKSDYLLEQFPPENFNLDKFLQSGDGQLSNFQTKILLGNKTYATLENMSAEEATEQAVDKLFNKVSYFGLQEYFDESLVIFSSALEWRLPIYVSKNTKDNNKALKFEERHLKIIKELNAIDLAVYEQAKERFETIIASPEFDQKKLQRLKKINKIAFPLIWIEYQSLNRILKYGHLVTHSSLWKKLRNR